MTRSRITTEVTFDEAVGAAERKLGEILEDDGIPPAKVTEADVNEGRARFDSFYEAPTKPIGRSVLPDAPAVPPTAERGAAPGPIAEALGTPSSLQPFSVTPPVPWPSAAARVEPDPPRVPGGRSDARAPGAGSARRPLPSAPWIFGLIAVGGLAAFAAAVVARPSPPTTRSAAATGASAAPPTSSPAVDAGPPAR